MLCSSCQIQILVIFPPWFHVLFFLESIYSETCKYFGSPFFSHGPKTKIIHSRQWLRSDYIVYVTQCEPKWWMRDAVFQGYSGPCLHFQFLNFLSSQPVMCAFFWQAPWARRICNIKDTYFTAYGTFNMVVTKFWFLFQQKTIFLGPLSDFSESHWWSDHCSHPQSPATDGCVTSKLMISLHTDVLYVC